MRRLALSILIFSLLFSSPICAQDMNDPVAAFRKTTGEIVLLKNHGGMLPLNTNEIGSVVLIGSAPHEINDLFGDSIQMFEANGVNAMNDITALDSSMVYIGQGVNGFSAKYYNNMNASGSPAKFATDKYIDFDWGTTIPFDELDSAAFSVQWDATLIPKYGPVKVKLIHNDGCRLYLDGKLIIDAWKAGAVRLDSAWLNIEKGKSYNLQIDYFSDGGPAMIKFGFEYLQEFLIREAVEKAGRADVAIMFVKQALTYGDDGSVENSYIIPNQSKLIRTVYETNPNTIVVLQTDSAVDIENWAFDIPAIIQAWAPDRDNGDELAEIIFGTSNPEGKLPFRWTMRENQNYDTRFPYGHGLTYSIFGIGKLLMKRNRDGSGWVATVETRNVGGRAGTETLQLYIRLPESDIEKTNMEIKAFKKLTLFPGQKKTVAIQMPYSSFEYYNDEQGRRTIDPGMYEILIGTSAEAIKLRKTIELKQEHINQYYDNE